MEDEKEFVKTMLLGDALDPTQKPEFFIESCVKLSKENRNIIATLLSKKYIRCIWVTNNKEVELFTEIATVSEDKPRPSVFQIIQDEEEGKNDWINDIKDTKKKADEIANLKKYYNLMAAKERNDKVTGVFTVCTWMGLLAAPGGDVKPYYLETCTESTSPYGKIGETCIFKQFANGTNTLHKILMYQGVNYPKEIIKNPVKPDQQQLPEPLPKDLMPPALIELPIKPIEPVKIVDPTSEETEKYNSDMEQYKSDMEQYKELIGTKEIKDYKLELGKYESTVKTYKIKMKRYEEDKIKQDVWKEDFKKYTESTWGNYEMSFEKLKKSTENLNAQYILYEKTKKEENKLREFVSNLTDSLSSLQVNKMEKVFTQCKADTIKTLRENGFVLVPPNRDIKEDQLVRLDLNVSKGLINELRTGKKYNPLSDSAPPPEKSIDIVVDKIDPQSTIRPILLTLDDFTDLHIENKQVTNSKDLLKQLSTDIEKHAKTLKRDNEKYDTEGKLLLTRKEYLLLNNLETRHNNLISTLKNHYKIRWFYRGDVLPTDYHDITTGGEDIDMTNVTKDINKLIVQIQSCCGIDKLQYSIHEIEECRNIVARLKSRYVIEDLLKNTSHHSRSVELNDLLENESKNSYQKLVSLNLCDDFDPECNYLFPKTDKNNDDMKPFEVDYKDHSYTELNNAIRDWLNAKRIYNDTLVDIIPKLKELKDLMYDIDLLTDKLEQLDKLKKLVNSMKANEPDEKKWNITQLKLAYRSVFTLGKYLSEKDIEIGIETFTRQIQSICPISSIQDDMKEIKECRDIVANIKARQTLEMVPSSGKTELINILDSKPDYQTLVDMKLCDDFDPEFTQLLPKIDVTDNVKSFDLGNVNYITSELNNAINDWLSAKQSYNENMSIIRPLLKRLGAVMKIINLDSKDNIDKYSILKQIVANMRDEETDESKWTFEILERVCVDFMDLKKI